MKTLQHAVRAIAHPTSLVFIGLLLLNDHFLKTVFPSFLTGKLSDFAGLYFFPYLLILTLSIPLGQLGVPANWIAGGAYWLTFAWFASLKTMAPVNDWTEAVAGLLRGGPVYIVQDPTDLMALIVLIPSWRLWREGGQTLERRIPRTLAAASFAAAVFASLATSPCMPAPKLTRLVYIEGNLYGNFDATTGYNVRRVIVSVDDGETWTETTNIPEKIAGTLAEQRVYPEIICLEESPGQCYRITGGDQIMRSEDGGETWSVDWEIPPARRGFMMRYHSGFFSCPKEVDFKVFDLAVDEGEAGFRIVAAMGNEGMLFKENDSPWERKPALQARPTPTNETDLSQLMFIFLLEIGASIFLGFSAFVILTIVVLNHAIAAGLVMTGGRRMKIFAPFLWGLIPAALILAMFEDILNRLPNWLEVAVVYLIPLSLIVALLMAILLPWKRAADRSGDPRLVYLTRRKVFKMVSGGILVTWAGLLGWATGLIPWYWMAAVLVFVGIGFVFFNGLQNICALLTASVPGSRPESPGLKD